MEYDKEPRPNGFNANFIKICWEIIHKDLLNMVIKYQQSEKNWWKHQLNLPSTNS